MAKGGGMYILSLKTKMDEINKNNTFKAVRNNLQHTKI